MRTMSAGATIAEKRFKRELYGSTARHKNRASEIKFDETTKQVIRELIDYFGVQWLSEQTELCHTTIYKLLVGYGDKCLPRSHQKIKEFLVAYEK